MAYESKDWVWSPTEATNHNYVSNLATMASSIENKVGRFVYSAEGVATITDSTNFAPFAAGNVIKVERFGKMVQISAIWNCKTSGYLNSASPRPFARIPVGFRPKQKFWAIYPISGINFALLEVNTDGVVNTSKAINPHGANTAMYISATYLAED